MSKQKIRRVVLVLLCYAVASVVVLLGASILSRLLALPDLFSRALHIGLILGVPISIVVAWIYPQIGVSGVLRPDQSGVSAASKKRHTGS